MADKPKTFSDIEIDPGSINALTIRPVEYTEVRAVIEDLKAKMAARPVLADRIKVIVDPYAKAGDEPVLMCSQAYYDAIKVAVPAAKEPELWKPTPAPPREPPSFEMCLQRARELAEWMRGERPTCDRDEEIDASTMTWDEAQQRGYDDRDIFKNAYIKRCAKCASTLLYPWARDLDVESVARALHSDPRFQEPGIDVSAMLQEFARKDSGGFKLL